MKIIDERQFDFIPQNKWKILSKKDQDKLRDYRRTYGHYSRNEDKITELEKELKKLNEKKKTYVHRLTTINFELDHLRNDFRFNWSVSELTNRKDYYNCYIGRKGRSKSGSLGNPKDITEHLKKYYKGNKSKLEELEDEGWKILTQRWISFFIALAILNEIIWRTQSTDIWVNFKVFGILPITFIFTMTQFPLIKKYQIED